MEVTGAIVLGVIEGVTEFIPVSSTAHLILGGDLLGWAGPAAKTFEIFIQLGAILAVVWLYRNRVARLVQCVWLKDERPLAAALLLSFLPAAVVGFLFHSAIKAHLFSPVVVGITLPLGGLVILLIERLARPHLPEGIGGITFACAFGIGLAQCLALIPGVSRSGATILGAMALGVPRKTATEYSFFLAIPTMFAATLYDLAKSLHELAPSDAIAMAVGFVVAFLSAVVVVRVFIRFVEHHTFTGFALYRIAFGVLALIYYMRR